MDCKEFEKKIPLFLQNSLDYDTVEQFQEHMSTCKACKEELSIQFLVTEGIKHLEKGDNFDLDGEFRSRIDASRRSHRRKGFWLNTYQWVLTGILFLTGAALIVIFG